MTRRISAGTTLALLLFVAFFDNFTQIPMISPYAKSLGASTAMAGWIVGIYSLTNMLGNVGAGWVLDKVGRRIPLAIGLAWAGFGVWLYGQVGTPWGLFGARAFHGLGGSVLVPAIFTLAADTLPEDRKGQGMGRIGAMIGLAAIFGPLFGGVLRETWGPHVVFASVFALMFAGALYSLTLPETLTRDKKRTSGQATPIPFSAAPFRIANAAGFAIAFNLGALTLMLPLEMERLGFGASRSGTVFSLFAVVAVAAMLIVGRLGKKGLLASGFFNIALGFVALTFASSFGMISLGMALYGVGFGLTYPTLNTTVATLYRVEERGRAYGIFYAFYSLGVVLAPPLVGWLGGYTSYQVIYGGLAVIASVGSFLMFQSRHVMAPSESGQMESATV